MEDQAVEIPKDKACGMRVFSIVTCALIFTAALVDFILDDFDIYLYGLVCFYLMGLSAFLLVFEIIPQNLAPYLQKWIPFLVTYGGRGILFIVLGTFSFGGSTYALVSGIVAIACGLLFIVVHFCGCPNHGGDAYSSFNQPV
mmetsp:Transcript_36608/g.41694  ORF Transcript_36608/g.41694 Transcript_36608/m.41694 type:complete len:142 (-) Transcript_36608:1003-1428(-)|eukprot:CAMPEP_0115007652 /NCGR_PEP_ID=MMETSP0216-20121206/21342_1 /TAXON_ID=223996 /ORGANISM="Protocruzia adherens, Strain Boccale" /LENGTH=141 /DNA_ID=CAMNT_0002374705 /DNA_START=59 /DNA_END=484 /DNA_ORIENTATION=+